MAGTSGATAEDYMADSMAQDSDSDSSEEPDRWITYEPHSGQAFEEWLNENLPSKTDSSDGVSWISVRSPSGRHVLQELFLQSQSDPIGLQESWEQLQDSGRPINPRTITEIAMMHGVKSGKWMIQVETGIKVDHLWSLVAHGVISQRLQGCGSAKVSPFNAEDNRSRPKHVICVYNNDFTNEEQVYELENDLRRIGIKCPLAYKPDVYTYVGIYRKNNWGLRPSLYRSDYDIMRRSSVIVSCDSEKESETVSVMTNWRTSPCDSHMNRPRPT